MGIVRNASLRAVYVDEQTEHTIDVVRTGCESSDDYKG